METELKITGIGFPTFTARGCVQTLEPIKQNAFVRTINGELLYLGSGAFHKFASTVVCQDLGGFATHNFAVGQEVQVSCIQRLWQPFEGGRTSQTIQLLRKAVSGSVLAKDLELKNISVKSLTDDCITLTSDCGGHLSYCPELKMRITGFSLKTQEWEGKTAWVLNLEEI